LPAFSPRQRACQRQAIEAQAGAWGSHPAPAPRAALPGLEAGSRPGMTTTIITGVFSEWLSHNRGSSLSDQRKRIRPEYGLSARLTGELITLKFTFRRERAYCCMEWSCHFHCFDGQRWTGLRRAFARAGLEPPARLMLYLVCVVEEGAIFQDFSRPRAALGQYEWRRSWAYAYELVTREGEAPAAAPSPKSRPRGGGRRPGSPSKLASSSAAATASAFRPSRESPRR
jgi:hypothetical protein